MKSVKSWFLTGFFLFISFFGEAKDWMPNGLIVDSGGNVLSRLDYPGSIKNSKRMDTFAFLSEFSRGTEIINLSNKKVFNVSKNHKENEPPPNDGSGFLVIKHFRMGSWNLPASKSFNILEGGKENSFFLQYGGGPFMGMAFEVGASVIGSIHVKKYEQIKKFPPLIILPTSLKKLNKYSVGDSFSYYINGGIGVSAGVGIGYNIAPLIGAGVSAGVSYVLQGKWLCQIQKTGQTTVSVRYTKRKLKKLRLFMGGSVVEEIFGIDLKKIKGIGNDIFFEFNLADPLGLAAYKKFLRGNTAYAMDMAHKLKASKAFALSGLTTRKWANRIMTTAIRPLAFSDSVIKTKEKGARFSIPLAVAVKVRKLKTLVVTNSRQLTDKMFVKTALGVHAIEKELYGWRKADRDQISVFTGNYQTISENEAGGDVKYTKRYSGNFKYEHSSEDLMEGDLERELFYLIDEVGHKKEILDLKIPQVPVNIRKYINFRNKKIPIGLKPKRKSLGFVKISVDLMLSKSSIDELKSQALFKGPKPWLKAGEKRVKEWFSRPENKRWEVCATMFRGKKTKVGRKLCLKKMLRRTREGLNLSYKSLVLMQKALAIHDEKKFVVQFAQFGKGLMSTQFSFLTLLKSLSFGDIHMVMQYQGERIPKGELVLIQSKKKKLDEFKVIK
ncbi:MAG: hypothetical protein VYD54_02605 [Bdellovibrionota bacterium]|nr:hypothetical protein [Bdellovibrionota bacterium]